MRAQVNEKLASAVVCANMCATYGAAELVRTPEGEWFLKINEIMCKGCGDCVAICPAMAIQMRHFKREQILDRHP